jgi:hypothetical protein
VAAAVEREKAPSIASVLESARKGELVGRKCLSCGKVTFLDMLRCDGCHHQEFAAFESKGVGEVVSFTIIFVPAEPFAAHSPYAFVVVKIADGGVTTGWVPGIKDPRQLRVGDRVQVIPAPEGLGIAFQKA